MREIKREVGREKKGIHSYLDSWVAVIPRRIRIHQVTASHLAMLIERDFRHK